MGGNRTLADVLPLVAFLKRRSMPLPEALFEVSNPDGSVVGTLELAWPSRKLGVVLDPQLVRLFPGWRIILYTGKDDELATAFGEAA
jgi:DEAD/DEAH box helicase domain-containing protein